MNPTDDIYRIGFVSGVAASTAGLFCVRIKMPPFLAGVLVVVLALAIYTIGLSITRRWIERMFRKTLGELYERLQARKENKEN